MVGRFRSDRRIHAWDLFNEPDNPNRSSYGRLEPAGKPELSLALLKKTFAWAREVKPSQPLTAGVWQGSLTDPEQALADQSLHAHAVGRDQLPQLPAAGGAEEGRRGPEALPPAVAVHRVHGPAGRELDSTRSSHTSRSEQIGAYNWGFVAGKSQTIYPWDSWQKAYAAEPPVWFHDIFRPDGTPYIADEVAYIRRVTGKAARRRRAPRP